jgi:hypothetical protein
MTPHEKFTRFVLYMALDMAYMTAQEILKSGMWEWNKEQREKYFEELNANRGEYLFRKALRTASMLGNQQPIIDFAGNIALDYNNNRLNYNSGTRIAQGLFNPFAATNAANAGGSFLATGADALDQIFQGDEFSFENVERFLTEFVPVANGAVGKGAINEVHAYINPESHQDAIDRRYDKAMRALNRMTYKQDDDAETIEEVLGSEVERGLIGEYIHPSLLTQWGWLHYPETKPDTSNDIKPQYDALPSRPTPTPSNIATPSTRFDSPTDTRQILERVRQRDPIKDILEKDKNPPKAPDLRP